MGLYNFRQRYAPFVQDGSKCHTIRAKRAHREKPGNTIHCFIGLRQKCVELLGRFKCTRVQEITIGADLGVIIDGTELSRDERNALAFADGFRSRCDGEHFLEMIEFWAGRLPFEGDIIHWQYSKAEVDRARAEVKQKAETRSAAIRMSRRIHARPLTEVLQ